ncbi:hypothetical protein SDJN02_03136 [Cucurbita argyrosperma subsp. argyrosperma]|nr:hypothetical protein SDJN02_03136 [Cucurbita argyrosperma subsp. argyrosperma]
MMNMQLHIGDEKFHCLVCEQQIICSDEQMSTSNGEKFGSQNAMQFENVKTLKNIQDSAYLTSFFNLFLHRLLLWI